MLELRLSSEGQGQACAKIDGPGNIHHCRDYKEFSVAGAKTPWMGVCQGKRLEKQKGPVV